MYDEVLCQTHAATAWRVKQILKSIKERWSWIKQDLVENFVNNCNNCAIRQLLRKHLTPLPSVTSAKPTTASSSSSTSTLLRLDINPIADNILNSGQMMII
ncbi:hypothetical protein RIR_jg27413.t1 [Rhizophagus irregularis DAOM 181602=DAOM 197198]|nr:hypothetical protein RhiirB3_435022 [Rhizophagus irregularis]GET50820.1 hypothetical protein RIR_jg27413.t1 [Rhizophagus irregularis DAOM 181602=DAOM 197198]